MRYNPEFPILNKFNEDETLAYQCLCIYSQLREEIVPNYIHSKIPSAAKDLRRTLIFKQMLKFVKTNRHRFKGYQFVLFMRAQLEVMRKLQNDGIKVLIEPSIFCGNQADKRWLLWKKWVNDSNKISKITYEFVASNLTFEFENTFNAIKNMCSNEITLENYLKESPVLLKLTILKKISPIYIYLSKWVRKLPEQIQNDLRDISNSNSFKDYDMNRAQEFYEKYFGYEN